MPEEPEESKPVLETNTASTNDTQRHESPDLIPRNLAHRESVTGKVEGGDILQAINPVGKFSTGHALHLGPPTLNQSRAKTNAETPSAL